MGHFHVGKKRKFGGFLKDVFGKWSLIPFYRKNWVLVDVEVHSPWGSVFSSASINPYDLSSVNNIWDWIGHDWCRKIICFVGKSTVFRIMKTSHHFQNSIFECIIHSWLGSLYFANCDSRAIIGRIRGLNCIVRHKTK